jgi:homoserine O-acetyltransferase
MNTADLLNIRVKEVMTTKLHTAIENTILKDIHNIFEAENIHHLPVVSEDNKFIGIISKSDMLLLMDWGTKLNLPASLRKNTFLLTSNLARDIMETNVIRINPEDDIRRCVQIFRENYFRALPVVDDEERLVGIITTYDLMILAYREVPLLTI